MTCEQIVLIDEHSSTSKYKQIVNSIVDSIADERLKLGDKLPSVNSLCVEWNLSRDTVLSAYAELKAKGFISSMPGKGYYVSSTKVDYTHKVFVLFDELNSFKEDLYVSFIEALGEKASVDIFFHHFNRKTFDSLLAENNGQYTVYVVMPAKFNGTLDLLKRMSGRVIILDQLPSDLVDTFPAVYQDFENDTFNALMSAKDLLSKYKKLTMIYPGGKEPEGQFRGFLKYCNESVSKYELIHELGDMKISKGEAYVAISDRDLVHLINSAKEQNLVIGTDVGIISYNDTELKQVVANGICVISTDFKAMGENLAQFVLQKKYMQIVNPSSLIIRNSL